MDPVKGCTSGRSVKLEGCLISLDANVSMCHVATERLYKGRCHWCIRVIEVPVCLCIFASVYAWANMSFTSELTLSH